MANVSKVLFLQVAGTGAHDDWESKLVSSLSSALGTGFEVIYPRLPDEEASQFAAWSAAIVREVETFGPGVLVGHSMGGAVLIQTLAKHPRLLNNITGVCLIAAPFLGDGGWPSADVTLVAGWANPLATFAVHLFHGDDDDTVPPQHMDLYAQAIPTARVHFLRGRDHQLNNDLTQVADVLRTLAP